jgi:UDP-2,3-diacylglucosamine pyrophosphatase LpxH
MASFPQFDEIYVVSDLHLGGEPGSQIFNSCAELVELVGYVRARRVENIAFVINGDFVDFLAEPGAVYFDPNGATDKLERIRRDPAFDPIFNALAQFVAQAGRYLVIALGNHDIELALPWVRSRLIELLAEHDEAAKGRITLCMDGAGFACKVGDVSVLCIHGNEVDPWNLNDYERLRRVGRDYVQGRRMEEWIPNAGTKLVIDVMNGIKRTYPFVDLLKPEVEAVVPVLLALEPALLHNLSRVVAVAVRLGWDSVRNQFGFLSEGIQTEPSVISEGAAVKRLLNTTFTNPPDSTSYDASRELMNRVEAMLTSRVAPLALVPTAGADPEMLGGFSAGWNWVSGQPKHEVVREALAKLKKDASFDLLDADSTFHRIDNLVGSSFDYVVAGHTHLERRLGRSKGRGMYFNSGTWVGLMNITEAQLSSEIEFKNVFDTLSSSRTIADLEGQPGLVIRKPAVVSITRVEGTVKARLQRVSVDCGELYLEDVERGVN